MYGPQQDPNLRISRLKEGKVTHFIERFRDRLQLDQQSGSLSITRLRLNDSGVYMCRSIGINTFTQHFNLTVYVSVSAPSIRVTQSEMSSSCSSLWVECSVGSSRGLSLSWFRGGDRLEQTRRPDSSSRLRLSLLVWSGDGEEYSCVAENPVDQKSSRLHTEDTCLNHGASSEQLSWCHTEATIRLLLSAVLALALMVLVADHIRLGRQSQPCAGSRLMRRRRRALEDQ
ncbi:hepatic and glial cell adhesion molecule-like isoform X2 [Halichoeres trimaculatus]